MTVHSGKWAAIDSFDTIRQWTINEVSTPARAIASNTGFAPVRKKGVRRWSGSYQAYGGVPALMPGEVGAFIGYGAPTDDVSGAGLRYTGNIMCDSAAITFNWRTGEIIGHTVNFSGHLALAYASGAAVLDAIVPDMPSIALCAKPTWKPAASGAHAALPNVSQITLNFSAANQEYLNTDTVVSGTIWAGRKAGPIDWSAAIQQDDDERITGVPQIDDDIELKIFVDATTFWYLKWGHVRDYSNITANRETGAILSRAINIDMTAHDGTALGIIQKPGAITWWPFA